MWGTLIKLSLTLVIALQMGGAVKASDSHSLQGKPSSIAASNVSDATGLASQDYSSHDTDNETSPAGHHHCKSHPTGSCCAFLTSSEIRLIPNSKDHSYGVTPNFFFFELVSSNLRPPSFLA